MNKLKQVGLTALGTALVSSSAVAADLAVTGGAKLVLVGGDKKNTGNGWSMTDSITFSGSADLDNGWTVSMSQNLSAGAANNAETSINMGEMGTLTFWKSSASSVASAYDDAMPAANEESWHGFTGTSGPGNGPVAAAGAANMFKYTVEVMDGLTFDGSYLPSSGATAVEGSSAWGLKYTGVEGLTVAAAVGENNENIAVTNLSDHAAGKSIENTAVYATYAIDAFTIGVQNNEVDSESANADYDYRGYGISYAVSDDLSVSYGVGTVDYQKAANSDQETSAVGLSYTSGGITISGSMHEGDNLGGSTAAANDRNAYELNIAFAF